MIEVTWRDKTEHCRTKPDGKRLFKSRQSPTWANENFHADHHTLHTKNISIDAGALLDFYFGTHAPNAKGAGGFLYTREDKPGSCDSTSSEIIITIQPGEKWKYI